MVPESQILQNARIYTGLAARNQLFMAAGSAGLDIGGHEKLVVGVGTDHGANVAAVQNRPRRLPGETALHVNQRGAHWRVNSDA